MKNVIIVGLLLLLIGGCVPQDEKQLLTDYRKLKADKSAKEAQEVALARVKEKLKDKPKLRDKVIKGKFNKDGEWIPEDKTILRTYKFPDVSAGFLATRRDIKPTLSIELWDTKKGFAGDFTVGENIAGISFSKRWTSIFEIKTGVWGGYNFKDSFRRKGKPGWDIGLMISIVKLW